MVKNKQILSALIDDETSELEVHRLLRALGEDPKSDALLRLSWARYMHLRQVSGSAAGFATGSIAGPAAGSAFGTAAGSAAESASMPIKTPGSQPATLLTPEHHQELHQRISVAIAAEADHDGQRRVLPLGFSSIRMQPALAASVALLATTSLVAVMVAVMSGYIPGFSEQQSSLALSPSSPSSSMSPSSLPSSSLPPSSLSKADPAVAGISSPTSNEVGMGLVQGSGDLVFAASRATSDNAGLESSTAETPELIELDEERQQQIRNYLHQHDRLVRMNQQQFVNFQDQDASQSRGQNR